jgi:protease-4
MDKNRKILVSILAFMMFSVVLSFISISLNMDKSSQRGVSFSLFPETSPGIGVVRISGAITMSGSSSAFSTTYGSEDIVERFTSLEQDPRIKAIVVRINSPGGSVAATQEIYQKIIQVRKKMPVIASLGDIAASGGYYVASACNLIYANQGTLTGSIGVIMSSPNLQELFKKLGIEMNVIKSGKYKDILSSSRALKQEEKAMLQAMIDATYMQFLKDVATGRDTISIDDIKPYADGRIMNGVTAKKYKLLDEIGTFEAVLVKARALANLSEDAPVYDEQRGISTSLLGRMAGRVLGIEFGNILHYEPTSLIEYRYIP